MSNQTAYKSDKARNKALASYENILNHWPVSFEQYMIPTSFGETYVMVSGSESAKPLILLHGGGGNSTMWRDNVAALGEHFRIYVIDIIGEAGKSSGTRPAYTSDGHARWLKEIFAALNIQEAALCGASLGGTLAHQFALNFPQYVTSLVLLAPPSFLKMRISFLFRAMLASMLPTKLFAKNFLEYISSCDFKFSASVIEAFIIQVQAYKPNINKIPIISDHNLARLPHETLLILGEDEVLYDPDAVVARIHSVASFITIAMIPGAKHMTFLDQPDLVNDKIIQFLN